MRSQDTAELFFDNVRIPAANVLGDPKGEFKYMMRGLAQAGCNRHSQSVDRRRYQVR